MTPLYIARSLKTIININKIIHCLHIHITYTQTANTEYHDFWEMVYVESGNAIAYADKLPIALTSGDIVFHKPNEDHAIVSDCPEGIKIHCISFQSSSKAMSIFHNCKIHLNFELTKLLHDMFEIADSTFESGDGGENRTVFVNISKNAPTGGQQLYKLYLETFLIRVIHLMESKQTTVTYNSKDDFEQKVFQKIMTFLSDSIYDNFSIPLLCKSLNYSKTLLCTIFKKYSGASIMQ